jgi:hypothetical protein
MPSIPKSRFVAAPGAEGRLPPDRQGQPEDPAAPDPQPVPGKALDSFCGNPESLLQPVRDRWSLQGWHWIRDTQLHEDALRYGGNGAGALATLRTSAMNLLRMEGFQSIRAGMQAVMHDITELLTMALRQPVPNSDLRL